jgi:CRISPR-associated exonuclease Cas4
LITGTQFAYYYHCKRHLWLFSNHINMEFNSDTVAVGRFISENSYKREDHEIKIDGISLDYFNRQKKVIHEIKKTDKMEMLHVRQVQYYIYVLESKGVFDVTGIIDYPRMKKRLRVKLTDKEREVFARIIPEIEAIVNLETPPEVIHKKFCRRCSYFELCYVD